MSEKFDQNIIDFLKSKDEKVHNSAIGELLKKVNLKRDYNYALRHNKNLINFFVSMKEARSENWVGEDEKKNMITLGTMVEEMAKNHQYKKIADIALSLLFRNLVDFLKISERKDFDTLTDADLFEKKIIPSEIFLQYFLFECLSKNNQFDWSRNDIIINQTFTCAGVCFNDIQEYIHELSDDNTEIPVKEESLPLIKEYFAYHKYVPANAESLPIEELNKNIHILESKSTSSSVKKKAIIILAHTGNKIALKSLQFFTKNSTDSELLFWVEQAIGECQLFMKK